MKLSRRLIPAFAMLLVSAVLMSTASFAWFTINSEVTATGMTVTATADSSLVIAGGDIEGNAQAFTNFTNVGTTTVAGELKPVTTFDAITFGAINPDVVDVLAAGGANAEWKYNTTTTGVGDDAVTTRTFSNDNFINIVDSEEDENFANHVVKATYKIKNIGGDAEIYVSNIIITVTEDAQDEGTAADLGACLRVAVKVGNGDTFFLYNAGRGTNIENEGVGKFTPADEENDTEAKWELTTNDPYTAWGGTNKVKIADLAEGVAQDVTIYVWIEGQDTLCHSNSVDASSFAIDVHFSVK